VDEKPANLATITAPGIDPNVFSIGSDAATAIGRIDPKAFPAVQNVARSAHAGIGSELAASIGETLRKINASPIGVVMESLQSTTRLVETTGLAETLKRIQAMPTFKFMQSLDGPIVMPRLAEALRPSFAAMGAVAPSQTFTAGVNDALKDLARMPKFEVGPRFGVAVREAAVIAESPAMREEVDDALFDLEDLSPAQRREFELEIANMIAAILTLVAYLTENRRVELATICLALAAALIAVYWRVTGKLDE
jgi:hypothetical protein